MAERETLLNALDGVERRLRLNLAVGHFTDAVSIVLGVAVVAVLLRAATPPRGGLFGLSLVFTLFLAACLVVVGIAVARALKRGSREKAAAEADRRAGLNDTLTSALWFSNQGETSPWIPLVMARAARAAAALDPVRLVPLTMPRRMRLALLLAVVLAVAAWAAPRLAANLSAITTDTTAVRETESEEIAALRRLAEEAARRGDEAARSKLEKVLAALERPGASDEEKRRVLDEARLYAEQRGLDAAADREQLRRLADQLGGNAEYAEVAKALRGGDARGAADALKRMLPEGERDAVRNDESLEANKADDASNLNALQESLQSAAQNPDRNVTGETQGRISKAVQNLEEIAKRLDGATALNQARRKLDAVSMSMSRETRLRAGRFGQQEGTPSSDSPETGEANIQGGAMYRQAAVAKEREGERDGVRAGDASGNAQGDPVLGDEMKRPEAKYKLETIRGAQQEGPEGEDDSTFYAASRQNQAKVQYRTEAPPQYRRAEDEAMNPERIGLRHRPIVKRYFTQLREQDAK
jgi:hypothetical protein